jgi:hypothetical protein
VNLIKGVLLLWLQLGEQAFASPANFIFVALFDVMTTLGPKNSSKYLEFEK